MSNRASTLIEARRKIFAELHPLATETIALEDGLFRVLREDLKATFTMPAYPQSTMDGYAISSTNSNRFHVIHEVPAGSSLPQISLKTGEAVQVFTGSILPQNTSAVVPIEHVIKDEEHHISLKQTADAQQFILPKGADFFENSVLVQQPKSLTPRDLALVASLGKASLLVSKRPKISIISTGSELIKPGMPPLYGKIYASNGYAIKGLCVALGCEVDMLPAIPDDTQMLEKTLQSALEHSDLIVTIGGASVGRYDLVRPVLQSIGAEFIVTRVQTRPGRPIFFASTKACPVLGLPGNPASATVGSWLYLADILKKLTGFHVHPDIPFQTARLKTELPANTSNFEIFHRATVHTHNSQTILTPLSRQESGLTYPTALADVLIRQKPYQDILCAQCSVDYLAPPYVSL